MALNQLVLPATLAVGQVLLLKSLEPLPAAAASATAAGPVAKPAASPATGSNPALYAPKAAVSASAASPAAQHTVVVGETLYSIARRYQVTVANLQAWNGKLDGNVKIGEVLRVQASAR